MSYWGNLYGTVGGGPVYGFPVLNSGYAVQNNGPLPFFDGKHGQNLTVDPVINSMLAGVNMTQDAITAQTIPGMGMGMGMGPGSPLDFARTDINPAMAKAAEMYRQGMGNAPGANPNLQPGQTNPQQGTPAGKKLQNAVGGIFGIGLPVAAVGALAALPFAAGLGGLAVAAGVAALWGFGIGGAAGFIRGLFS